MPQALHHNPIVIAVASLKPGESIEIDNRQLYMQKDLAAYYHNNVTFTPQDRVLENIVGSSYEFTYSVNDRKGTTTFFRLEKECYSLAYKSPDRR